MHQIFTAAQSEALQPNNLFNSVKKGKNFHRRTQSTNAYDFDAMLNIKKTNPNLMEEIARQYGVSDTAATKKAVEASSNKQEERNIIVEDIDEIPNNIGWIVPKNPNSNMNPLHVVKKRDLAHILNSNPPAPTKKLEKFTDQELVNDLTGLNVISERHQSIESSDIEALNSGSRGLHTRTSSCNDPSLFAGKQAGTAHLSQNMSAMPSGFKPHHNRIQLSGDNENKTSETCNNSLLQNAQPQHQPSPTVSKIGELFPQRNGSHSTKNAKDLFNLNMHITPEVAKNFLKVLDKNRKSSHFSGTNSDSKAADHKAVSKPKESEEKKQLNRGIQNHTPEDEKMMIIRKLEAKVSRMSAQIEQLTDETCHLKEQVIDLSDTIKILGIENMTLKKVISRTNYPYKSDIKT